MAADNCEYGHYPLPVFLMLRDRPCLVVGGGRIAARKTADLLECGAVVTVVDPAPCEDVEAFAREGRITLERRAFAENDTDGKRLVFAATDDPSVNARAGEAADSRGIPVNVVDTPGRCTFISGAVVKRGPLRIAVSTSGCCPGLARDIRRDLEARYTGEWESYVRDIGELRRMIVDSGSAPEDRRREAFDWLAGQEARELHETEGKDGVWRKVMTIVSRS